MDEVFVKVVVMDDPTLLLSLRWFVVCYRHVRLMSFHSGANLISCFFSVFFFSFDGRNVTERRK